MSLGDNIRVTLFGESHGPSVGALLEGIPPGTNVPEVYLLEVYLSEVNASNSTQTCVNIVLLGGKLKNMWRPISIFLLTHR